MKKIIFDTYGRPREIEEPPLLVVLDPYCWSKKTETEKKTEVRMELLILERQIKQDDIFFEKLKQETNETKGSMDFDRYMASRGIVTNG